MFIKKCEQPNNEGMCPKCHEYTTAGDSCCGYGAYIEGNLVTDESAIEDMQYNSYCITLLSTKHYKFIAYIHHILFNLGRKLGFTTSLTGSFRPEIWTLRIFVHFKKRNCEENNTFAS